MKTFLYWTILGFSHAFIFFFGSYFLIGRDTSLLGNGQVKYTVFYRMFLIINVVWLLITLS